MEYVKNRATEAWNVCVFAVEGALCIAKYWLGLLVLNWILARIYANYCVPAGFFGLLSSMMTAQSSTCRVLLDAQKMTMDSYTVVSMYALHQLMMTLAYVKRRNVGEVPGGRSAYMEEVD